jgi:iron complex outermembrane receptor protein
LVQPGTSAAEVLRESPALQISELGGFAGPATASIRGATAAQTPVYFAGVRINDEVGGTANLSDIPLRFVERIEVYRSHAPLVSDQLGIGGAIFFEPRRALGNELELSAMAGSYGSRSASAAVSLSAPGSGMLAAFELAGAENDYLFSDGRGTLFDPNDDGKGRRSNADASTRSFFLLGNRRLGGAHLELLHHHAEREQGAPKLALTPSESARVAFRRDLFALRSKFPIQVWEGSLELVTQGVLARTTLDDPQAELGLQGTKLATPGERLEQTAIARQHPTPRLQLVEQFALATERLGRNEAGNGAPRALEFSAQRHSARAALSAELGLSGALFAEAALSFSLRDTHAAGLVSKSEHEPSGRIGLNLRTTAIELYAAVGRYHRVPTLSELYGASLLTRGNPELDVESGTTLEAGARHQLLHSDERRRLLWLDAAAFSRFSSDLVSYARTAQGYMLPLNLKRSRTLGAELSLGSEPLAFLDLLGSLSLLDPRDTSDARQTRNDTLPFSSRLSVSGLVNVHTALDFGALDFASFGVRAAYSSSRYADFAGLQVIPQQSSLTLETALGFYQGRVTGRARVTNLTDARNFDVVGFPLPGRSGFLTLEAKL